jgi:hypothetical protein
MALHEPVLTREVVDLLQPARGGVFVDCTVGLGGHARAMLDAGATHLVGLDRDAEALAQARAALAAHGDRVTLVHADYRDLDAVLEARGLGRVHGILADLGVSSMQLDAEGGASASGATSRSTCAWTAPSGRRLPTWLGRDEEGELADTIYAVRRGAVLAADRPRDRRGARPSRPSRRRASWPRSCGGRCRRAATSGSTRRRARSRRSGSG